MIKVNIVNLKPEGRLFEGTENKDFLNLEGSEFLRAEKDIKYSINVMPVNNGILVQGYVETELICKCGLCLSEYNYKLENNDICHFYEKPEKHEIDLTDDIREDILIALPVNFKCSKNCKGLCLKCGQNLNEKECDCDKSESTESPWSELDNIKL